MNLLLTFGLVPLIAVGVTVLYDAYIARRNSASRDEKKGKGVGTDGSKGRVDTSRSGSFEDIMRPNNATRSSSGGESSSPDNGTVAEGEGKRRSSSSFFQDEEENGDPKGRESRVFEKLFDEVTVPGGRGQASSSSSSRRQLDKAYQNSDDEDGGSDRGFRPMSNPLFLPSNAGRKEGEGEEGTGAFSPSRDGHGIKEGPWTTLGLEQPLVVAMVGLPAR